MFKRRQVWVLRWPWESRDSVKLNVILDNTCTMGSCTVVLKDECISMPTGIEHNKKLNSIVCVVEPSDIPLVDVQFCPPSHGDPSPNDDTSNGDHGLRLVTLPSSTPNPLPPIMKIENEFRLVWARNVRPLCHSPLLTESAPYPPCLAFYGSRMYYGQ